MPRKETGRKGKWEEQRRKGSRQRMKPPTQTWTIDVLIGDEKQKKAKKKNTRTGPQTQLPSFLQSKCIIHWGYSETLQPIELTIENPREQCTMCSQTQKAKMKIRIRNRKKKLD